MILMIMIIMIIDEPLSHSYSDMTEDNDVC